MGKEHIKAYIEIGGHKGETASVFRANNPGYKVFVFECDPRNFDALRALGFDKAIESVAWVYDGHVRFYTGMTNAGSVCRDKKTGGVNRDVYTDAPCVDLARWLRENLCKDDYIYLRMNCEGAEYDLIPHLKQHGLLSWVDKWDVSWHWHKINKAKAEHDICAGMIKND